MLLGFSGKMGSGKDTAAEWIRQHWIEQNIPPSRIQTVRFADKVKEIVALVLGVSVEMLNNREFKQTKLGSDWIVWKVTTPLEGCRLFSKKSEALSYCAHHPNSIWERQELTPRDLLIRLATDLGRNSIHPNIWVLATQREISKHLAADCFVLVPDIRFENEVQALQDLGGLVLRVNRKLLNTEAAIHTNESETQLDNFPFDWAIDNNGSLNQFREQVLTWFHQITNRP